MTPSLRKLCDCFGTMSGARISALAIALTLVVLAHTPSARAASVPPPQNAATPVSFRNDVMPVLSKAGCNAGACHGNKSGKGGFKLSLRGQDPGVDYETLTRD